VSGNPLYLSGASGSSAAHSSGIDQPGAARSAAWADTYPTPRRLEFAVAEAEEGNQPQAKEGAAPQARVNPMQGIAGMEDLMGAMSLGTPGSSRPVVKWVGTGGIPFLDHMAVSLVAVAEAEEDIQPRAEVRTAPQAYVERIQVERIHVDMIQGMAGVWWGSLGLHGSMVAFSLW
jgi:hypothetical protein